MRILRTALLISIALNMAVASSDFDNIAQMKKRLGLMSMNIEGVEPEDISSLKNALKISDGELRQIAIELFKEMAPVLSQQRSQPHSLRYLQAWQQTGGALIALGLCADVQGKDFLLMVACDANIESSFRMQAIASYLKVSGSEEAKTALLRFLVSEDRMDGMARLGLYSHAQTVYEEAPPDKKAAILAALLAAAKKEEGKIEFIKVDKILSARSPMYRQSQERLRLLDQHSKGPPTTNLYTDRDLKAALDEARSYAGYIVLGTNLAALSLLDSPQADQLVPNLALVQKDVESTNAKCRWHIIGIGLVAGLAAAAGVWFYRKKRAV